MNGNFVGVYIDEIVFTININHPCRCHILVGGFNPFEKYARQIGSFPQINRDENKNCLKPPPSILYYTIVCLWASYHYNHLFEVTSAATEVAIAPDLWRTFWVLVYWSLLNWNRRKIEINAFEGRQYVCSALHP